MFEVVLWSRVYKVKKSFLEKYLIKYKNKKNKKIERVASGGAATPGHLLNPHVVRAGHPNSG